MKKFTVFFMSALFLVMCLSLYMMLESATQWQTNRLSALGENELSSIEVKIKEIETILQHNQQTINLIKDTVRELAQGDTSNIARLDQIFNGGMNGVRKITSVEIAYAEARREVAGVCPWKNWTSRSDIQMWEELAKVSFEDKDGGVWKQGFPISYSLDQWLKRPLKVFVVPHSHTDPGWIKTFDRYFEDQTRKILDNMLLKLGENPKLRFIYAEMSFFSTWWDGLSSEKRRKVKSLVSTGQLELVSGGWVMTDEANTHFYSMLDQLIEGHSWMRHNIGQAPNSSWSIDPFGHSPTMAYLLKKATIPQMVIQRVHYSIKRHLAQRKQLEFLWRQTWDPTSTSDTFCHMMPFFSYDVPHTCGPDPRICCQFDFKRLPGSRVACPWRVAPQVITSSNVEKRSRLLIDQYRKKAQLFHSDVVLAPLGDDFRYDTPTEWTNQMDNYQKIMDFVNQRKDWNVQMQFGTLSEFFAAARERLGPSGVPSLSGDFYTYADRQDHYWAGYFTSRPFHKNLDRLLEWHVRSAEIIFTLAQAYARKYENRHLPTLTLRDRLMTSRRTLALFQHHDAVTGTAKDHVVVDYGRKLLTALMSAKQIIKDCAFFLSMPDKQEYRPDQNIFDVDEERRSHDSLPDKTVIQLSDKRKSVLFYNSLARKRRVLIRLYVNSPHVEVRDPANTVIRSQADPYWLNNDDIASDIYKLVFVVEVPALGLSRYMLRTVVEGSNSFHGYAIVDVYNTNAHTVVKKGPFQVTNWMSSEKFTIENSQLKLTFSTKTGTLQTTLRKDTDAVLDTEIEFVTYGARNSKEKSGAYIFLPDGPGKPVNPDYLFIRVVRGELLQEAHVFLPMVEHVVRLTNARDALTHAVEIYNIVDIRNTRNTELAMRVKTGIRNADGVFYTDLNGFQMSRRKYLSKLPPQANFYPMSTMAYLEDSQARMTLLTQQSLGFTSQSEGVFEVMMDRRLNQDDNRGLGQPLIDNRRTPNKFMLLWEQRENSQSSSGSSYPSLMAHHLSSSLLYPLHIIPQTYLTDQPITKLLAPSRDLPCDLDLVNFRSLGTADEILNEESLMIVHRKGYDCAFPKLDMTCNTTSDGWLNLTTMFKDFHQTEAQKVSLTLIKDGDKVEGPVQIPTMELESYKVTLR